jgi:hypothetical protein
MQANKNIQNMPPKFYCEKCDYGCCKKSSWEQHLLTAKHSKANFGLMQANKEYACEKCTIKFKHQSSYCRHKKKCQETTLEINKDEVTDKELIMMLLKQNSQLIEQNAELTKNGINNTTISNNTNSLNKTFNLQFFLNETCKDAMNIMDFVDSIKLQLSDLEKVGHIGYVEGISNIITTNLKALDVTQRPIHCTDKKRETLYIKDEDKWEKENEEKNKIKKVIKKVANKNIMLLQKFKEVHPDCGKSASKYSDQYNKIIIESMGGPGDNDSEKEDKIIKNISNVTTIDK